MLMRFLCDTRSLFHASMWLASVTHNMGAVVKQLTNSKGAFIEQIHAIFGVDSCVHCHFRWFLTRLCRKLVIFPLYAFNPLIPLSWSTHAPSSATIFL